MRVLAYILGSILTLILYVFARGTGGLEWWQAFPLLFVVDFVAFLLHELGHAWAFLKVGGSVHSIVVMRIEYDVLHSRWSWIQRDKGGDIGGYVMGDYGSEAPSVSDRLLVSFAGPLANLGSGGLALIAASLWPKPILAGAGPTDSSLEGMARLPDPETMERVFSHVDNYQAVLTWWQFGETTLILFGLASPGLTLLNLLPYDDSDGQHVFEAFRDWRAGKNGA